MLGGLSPSIRLPRGTQGYSACTLSGKTITEIPEYDSGVMDKERTEYSTLKVEAIEEYLLGELTPSTRQVADIRESSGGQVARHGESTRL